MFDIIRIDESMNIFFIVKKSILSKEGNFKKLPFSVYGFLCVGGTEYEHSTISYKNISDEITKEQLDDLVDLAKITVFDID